MSNSKEELVALSTNAHHHHLRHNDNNNNTDKLSVRRIVLHIIKVGVRMALFRLIFGFVKQLLIKGAIVKGFKKISVGIEIEVVSYNPLKWACFGMSLAAYRPVQVILEKAVRSFSSSSKKTSASSPSAGEPGHEHENRFDFARTFSIILAGALVSLPINSVFNKNTRVELMLYVVVRALHSVLSGIVYPSGILPEFMARLPTEFWNSSALAAVSALLLGASTFHPETHSKEYANFLVTATTLQTHQMQSLNCMHANHWSPAVADMFSRMGINDVLGLVKTNAETGLKTMPSESFCRAIHPNYSSCNVASLDHMFRHFMRVSLPLYGPLKVVTTLMKGPHAIMKNPVKILKSVVTSIAKSGMFLTLYVCGSYRITCLFNQFGIRSRLLASVVCGINCGLALLLEPAERQTDLVLFCSMHALRCTYLTANKMNLVQRPTMSTVSVAHAVAWAAIFFVYELRPSTLRGIFATMLKFLIGDKKETHPETVQTKHHQPPQPPMTTSQQQKSLVSIGEQEQNGDSSARATTTTIRSSSGNSKRVKFSQE